jgi:hypothetical protein
MADWGQRADHSGEEGSVLAKVQRKTKMNATTESSVQDKVGDSPIEARALRHAQFTHVPVRVLGVVVGSIGMKLGATETIKFKKLKMRFKLKHWETIGLLESIWMFTSRNAPQGDLGIHSNEDICAAIEWERDHDELIETLIECRWLDVSSECRFVVHDWGEHMPNWLRGNLAKHRKPVKIGDSAKQRAKQTAQQCASEPSRHGPIVPY